VLFSSDDERKEPVRLIADGVKLQFEKDSKPIASLEPLTALVRLLARAFRKLSQGIGVAGAPKGIEPMFSP
jgi:hypothetical protein